MVEKLGTPLPEHLILLDRSFAYTEVGVHSVVVDGLINMLGVPMGLGVLGSLMPIFGDPDPSLDITSAPVTSERSANGPFRTYISR